MADFLDTSINGTLKTTGPGIKLNSNDTTYYVNLLNSNNNINNFSILELPPSVAESTRYSLTLAAGTRNSSSGIYPTILQIGKHNINISITGSSNYNLRKDIIGYSGGEEKFSISESGRFYSKSAEIGVDYGHLEKNNVSSSLIHIYALSNLSESAYEEVDLYKGKFIGKEGSNLLFPDNTDEYTELDENGGPWNSIPFVALHKSSSSTGDYKLIEIIKADYSVTPLKDKYFLITGVLVANQSLRTNPYFKIKFGHTVRILSVNISNIIQSSNVSTIYSTKNTNTYNMGAKNSFNYIPQWYMYNNIYDSKFDTGNYNTYNTSSILISASYVYKNLSERNYLASNGFSFSIVYEEV